MANVQTVGHITGRVLIDGQFYVFLRGDSSAEVIEKFENYCNAEASTFTGHTAKLQVMQDIGIVTLRVREFFA